MILFFYFGISVIRYILTILLSYDLLHLLEILYFYYLFKDYVITIGSFQVLSYQYLISIALAVVYVPIIAFLSLAYVILSTLLSLAGHVSPTAQVTL